jgi:hypothetical protein
MLGCSHPEHALHVALEFWPRGSAEKRREPKLNRRHAVDVSRFVARFYLSGNA